MGSYLWQIERAELLYSCMIDFFTFDCLRIVKLRLETQQRVRKKLFTIDQSQLIKESKMEKPMAMVPENKPFDLSHILKSFIEEQKVVLEDIH